MSNYKQVTDKLEKFIQKFYVNELIKGGILFLSFGLLYFILVVALEHFFWLSSMGRTILFWAFVLVEFTLFIRFMVFPLLKLFKLSKGLDYHTASTMIGTHFKEVSDKLTNIIQLKENHADSDLLIASIEQKAKEIKPVPFQFAIRFSSNLKYAKYLVIPMLILFIVWASGQFSLFSESYKRVVDYKTVYTPPAPFRFVVLNASLEAEEGKDFKLQIFTEGEVTPEEAQIRYQGQAYFLQKNEDGQFEYQFENLKQPLDFQLKANQVTSPVYSLDLIKVPKINDFSMHLDYPSYTGFSSKEIKGTGNAQFPEGTLVQWKLNTNHTDKVTLSLNDSVYQMKAEQNTFLIQKNINRSSTYQIATSNSVRSDYETMNFKLEVIKDEYPKLDIESKKDSLKAKTTYFQGKATDDYGLSRLQLVYYPSADESQKKVDPIAVNTSNYAEFLYVFPNDKLELVEGETYSYFFEVFDNDAVNGRKKTKSRVFNYQKSTQLEAKKEKLDQQSQSIKGMQKSLEDQKKETKNLEEIERLKKEKDKLSFSDKKKIENYLKRQQQQRQMMKNFSKELKENLQKFQPDKEDSKRDDLIDRLEQNEQSLDQDQDLLDELEKYREKLDEEQLDKELKESANQNKKQERSLEQLLELTKRYYVERKMEQLVEELNDLAEKQQQLSEEEQADKSKQDNLNDRFEDLREELEKLEQENQNLKKPMDFFRDTFTEDEIEQDMQDASDLIEKENTEKQNAKQENEEGSDASDGEDDQQGADKKDEKSNNSTGEPNPSSQQKQKDAAEKLKELSKKMGMSMMAGGMAQQTEDVETLRRIYQNLLRFSFEQEDLMIEFDQETETGARFAKNLRKQADLRENFKHIDDSLFTLALRNEIIGEQILNKITDIQYNIELSLERLADNKISLGQSNQQYVMTNANDLANLLDDALDNMEEQLSGGGGQGSSGEGDDGDSKGFQLSDIIKSHEELQEEMQGAMGQNGEGEESGDEFGDSHGDGDQQDGSEGEASDGDAQSDGEMGENGNQPQDGDQGEQQGSGDADEQMSSQLYEIYKKQQALKQQLEDRIKELGIEADAKNLRKSLDQLEEELLMKGFSSDVLKQMKNITHQLLKLEEAVQKQGEEEKREATTNTKKYEQNPSSELDRAKEYFNTIEILNRQQLPLQPKYKDLIKSYFNEQQN